MNFELKLLSPDAVPRALAKAERYRLLNEPGAGESIGRDALDVDPDSQAPLVTVPIALSEQFDDMVTVTVNDAWSTAQRIQSDYDRQYYTGIVWERRAKARLKRGIPGCGPRAYEWLREAMEFY